MHDIRSIRENPAAFDQGLRSRGMEPLSERLIALDDQRKNAISALQAATERRNAMSKEIGQAKAKKDEARAQELMAEVARIKETMPELEEAERVAEKGLFEALAAIPNIPKADVPVGADEHGNVERHRVGTPRMSNSAKQHFEIGEALGLMDFETAAKLSGSRFVVLKAGLARLERALGQFMIDLHTNEHGYTEVNPPLLVRDEAMFGTAQLPKFEDDQFWAFPGNSLEQVVAAAFDGQPRDAIAKMIKDTRYGMIPTAEVTLTNLVREQILSEEELPLRFTALTPSFRAEAGSAGRDTRGMIRQHQFVKCELVDHHAGNLRR
jgi:seryl-tRNA synthetase